MKTDIRMSGNEGIYVCTPTLLPPTHSSCFCSFWSQQKIIFPPTVLFPMSALYLDVFLLMCLAVSMKCCEGRGISILILIGFQWKEIKTEAIAMIRKHLDDVTSICRHATLPTSAMLFIY